MFNVWDWNGTWGCLQRHISRIETKVTVEHAVVWLGCRQREALAACFQRKFDETKPLLQVHRILARGGCGCV